MSQQLLALGGVAALVLFFIKHVIQVKKDPLEPVFLDATVPYFGHVMGILVQKTSYYLKLSAKYGHQIYSLAVPASRIYVVNSLELLLAVQKRPHIFSFWYIEAAVMKNLAGISTKANDIILKNARGEKGIDSLVVAGMKVTHAAMVGENLERMTLEACERAARQIALLEDGQFSKQIDLWLYVQQLFSLAISSGVYGPRNPYEDPLVVNGLQDYADSTMLFLSGLPASVFAPKGYAARERIVSAFERYFDEDGQTDGSELVRARIKVLREYGIPEPDVARFEAANGFGILLNLLPTAFWTLFHLTSDPTVLETVRKEAVLLLSQRKSGDVTQTVHLSKIDSAPVLASIIKESLRFHSSGAAARVVTENHMLNGKYLLKRDSVVIMPNRSAHFEPSTWGDRAAEFDPYRFDRRAENRANPAAFRGFGGGANLCPGRSFAARVILVVTALLVLRFDFTPLTNSGKWEDPEHDESNMAIVVARPKRKVVVNLEAKREWTGLNWAFSH